MTDDLQSGLPSTGSSILARHAIGEDDRLGQGTEAVVYRLDTDRVLKIFGPHVNPLTIESRRALCASLDRSKATFAVPQILDLGQESGTHYTIEARIPGSSLSGALSRLVGTARHAALLAYAEASTRVADIGLSDGRFGEIVAAPPLLADSWAEFVAARAEADLRRSGDRLAAAALDRPGRALARLEAWLAERPAAEPRLVHGDYYPANVMVDDAGRVTGVIDFGGLTLRGDPRLDPACALLFLTGLDGVTADDRRLVSDHLRRRGLGDEDIRLCALFYAFRFLDTPREGLFRWCLDTIRGAC